VWALVLLLTASTSLLAAVSPAAAVPGFTMTIDPQSQELVPGESTGFLIKIGSLDEFADQVRLEAGTPETSPGVLGPLPNGVTAVFSANPVNAPGQSILTIAVAANATVRGTFDLVIRGTSGALHRELTRQATVLDFGLVPQCTGTITGTVTDKAAGGPLSGVSVAGGSGTTTTTDAAGTYRFDDVPLGPNNSPSEPTLTFTKDPDYWFVNRTAAVTGDLLPDGTCQPNVTTVNVALLHKIPAFVSGQVVKGTVTPPDYETVTATTTPIEGVQVCPYEVGVRCATTQADGRYPVAAADELPMELRDNQARDVFLVAYGPGTGTRHGYWDTNTYLTYPLGTVQPGEHLQKTVALVKMCTSGIIGTVTNTATGGPAANVRVSAFVLGIDTDTVTTDAEGRFAIPELLLGVNNRPVTYSVQAGTGPFGHVTLDHCGDPPAGVDLTVTIPPTGSIAGVVRDQDTLTPIAGATVGFPGGAPGGSLIICPQEPCPTTSPQGQYTLDDVAGGPTAVTAAHDDYWGPEQATPVEVTPGTTVTAPDILMLRRRFAAIEGTVTDQATGQPIEGANVIDVGYSATSDLSGPDGKYLLDPVQLNYRNAARTVPVDATAPGYWDRRLQVDVTAGTRTRQDIALIPVCAGGTITGTVRNSVTGKLIEGATVFVLGVGSAETDAAGHYSIGPVPVSKDNDPRDVDVTVFADGFNTLTKRTTVTCGATITLDFGSPPPTATLVVAKRTVGGTGSFAFTSTGGLTSPADTAGNFTLATTTANPDQVTFAELPDGTAYTVAEKPDSLWQLTDISCAGAATSTVRYGTGSTFAHTGWQTGDDAAKVTVAGGDTVTCTFTNSRQTGYLELAKKFVNAPTSAKVNLLATSPGGTPGDAGSATDIGNGGSTGRHLVPPGTYTLAETPGTGTSLADYSSALACVLRGTTTPVPTTNAAVTVNPNDDVVCTFTNTRQTGYLELTKKFVNAPTSAKVNLLATSPGGTPGDVGSATDVGNGGSTGRHLVPTGTYTLAETAGTGTSLSGYSSALACVLRGTTTPVRTTNAAVTVNPNDDVVCTFTNTRQAPKTGAKTIGYWQNKNGQAIIKGGAATNGVCNVGSWLRGYAPFQDLSTGATCTQVAGYVLTLVKAATAKGAAMNAMLKAQMVATALDVYFSDPTLGGNKIAAPTSIGGRVIDLTMVCKMIDGSAGTATCSVTYRDASSAFGGSNALAVAQMLSYAAAQANVGGSSWYGNVKSQQELAKDAFDATDNEAAFSL
jgi:hypothetical protein